MLRGKRTYNECNSVVNRNIDPGPTPCPTLALSASSPSPSPSASSHPNITALYVSQAQGCVDSGVCTAASPCCSLKYAVEAVAAFMVPATEFVSILMEAGVYGVSSCGIHTQRPLVVQGLRGVTIDCGGSGRVLSSSTSLCVGNLTLQGGYVSDGSDGGAVSIVSSDVSPLFAFVGVVFRNNTVLNGNGGGLSINVTHGAQLSGVTVMFESITFEGNGASCNSANCARYSSASVANGGGVSIMLSAPVVTGTLITALNCTIVNNTAAMPAGEVISYYLIRKERCMLQCDFVMLCMQVGFMRVLLAAVVAFSCQSIRVMLPQQCSIQRSCLVTATCGTMLDLVPVCQYALSSAVCSESCDSLHHEVTSSCAAAPNSHRLIQKSLKRLCDL